MSTGTNDRPGTARPRTVPNPTPEQIAAKIAALGAIFAELDAATAGEAGGVDDEVHREIDAHRPHRPLFGNAT